MSDIFISYARSTEREARQIAEALRGMGFGVWRDDEIPAHRSFADVIEERLTASKAVVVLWSADAVKSTWVQSEADRARTDNKLVQLNLDGARLPMPFDRIQCASLAGWSGDAAHPGWRQVADSIAALCGKAGGPTARAAPAPASSATRSICVLPFQNMSGDPEQEYFSDGISEDITTDLSKVAALEVTARNTAFAFKGQSPDVTEIARRLGVTHVLEGSVRKAGNRVRITAQLIDGATGKHAWADRWDRDLDDIFALQDEISQAIVAALKVKLLPAEKKAIEKRGTESPEAYDLYLMARKLRVNGNASLRSEEAVVDLCRRAVAVDPNYALAWVLMAVAQGNLSHRFGLANDGGAAATERALALSPNLAEAHALKARQLHRAGRPEDVVAELDLALRLDPDSYDVNNQAASIHYLDGRFAEAVPYFEKCIALSETEFAACGLLQSCLSSLGDHDGARRAARLSLERAEKAVADDPGNGYALSFGVGALAGLGEHDKARQWIDRALLLDPDNQAMRYNFACALSTDLNDADGALSLLGQILASPEALTFVESARMDPDFDPIRGDPRFRAMMAETEARLGKKAG